MNLNLLRKVSFNILLTIGTYIVILLFSSLLVLIGITTPRPFEIFNIRLGILTITLLLLFPLLLFFFLYRKSGNDKKASYVPLFAYPVIAILFIIQVFYSINNPPTQARLNPLCGYKPSSADSDKTVPESYLQFVIQEKEFQCAQSIKQAQTKGFNSAIELISATNKENYLTAITKGGWNKFSSNSLGIEFEFLITENSNVIFNYDVTNQSEGVEFTLTQRPIGTDYGGQIILWSQSKGAVFGRNDIEPLVYKWTNEGNRYFLLDYDKEKQKESKIEVKKLMVTDLYFKEQALLYDTDGCKTLLDDVLSFGCAELKRRLIINLPIKYTEYFESVTFHIPNYFTNDDIKRILASFKLTRY